MWCRSGTGPIPWLEVHPEGWERPLILASVYMPQQGRAAYQEEVQVCLQAILAVVLEAQRSGSNIVLMGDFNLSHLADQVGQEARHGRGARFEAEFEALNTLFHILHRGRLRVCEPEGGFTPTFIPYAQHISPSCLDYCDAGHGCLGHIQSFSVDTEATTKTDHLPLLLELRSKSTPRRQKLVRRKWPAWKEGSAGQLAELLREGSLRDVSAAERDRERDRPCSQHVCSKRARESPHPIRSSRKELGSREAGDARQMASTNPSALSLRDPLISEKMEV